MSDEAELIIKVVIIGDVGVGKSCLLLRYTDEVFTDEFVSTIGVDFKFKNITLDDTQVRLQIWDTAGQERFLATTKAYFRGAMGIMMVYDMTDDQSFDNVKNKWHRHVEDHADQGVLKILVGNKSDLEDDKMVQTNTAEEFAKELDIPFLECSAKSGININDIFETLARNIKTKKMAERNSDDNDENVNLSSLSPNYRKPPSQKSKCC